MVLFVMTGGKKSPSPYHQYINPGGGYMDFANYVMMSPGNLFGGDCMPDHHVAIGYGYHWQLLRQFVKALFYFGWQHR